MAFFRFIDYDTCLTASLTMAYGSDSVTLDTFTSETSYNRTPSYDLGYKVYGTIPPQKISFEAVVTLDQYTGLLAVYNGSMGAWGNGLDGSITLTDNIRTPSLTAAKYTIDFFEPKKIQGGNLLYAIYSVSIQLTPWIAPGDTGIRSIALSQGVSSISLCRFNGEYKRDAVTAIVTERSTYGTVLVSGPGYIPPIPLSLSFICTAAEKSTLQTIHDNSGVAYRAGTDGKISVTDGINGGSYYANMSAFQPTALSGNQMGRWAVSFSLVNV